MNKLEALINEYNVRSKSEKHDKRLYVSRDMSWLEFNKRVLYLASAKHFLYSPKQIGI